MTSDSPAGLGKKAKGYTKELVAEPLEEIPADSTCITFQRARAEAAIKASASG